MEIYADQDLPRSIPDRFHANVTDMGVISVPATGNVTTSFQAFNRAVTAMWSDLA